MFLQRKRIIQSTSSYESTNIGGALRTGFRLDEYSSVGFKYTLAYRDVSGIDRDEASPAIIAQEGSSLKSSVGATYTWDDLDNPNRPTLGFRGQLGIGNRRSWRRRVFWPR